MGVQLLQERPDVVEPLLAEAEAESGLPLRALLSGGSPEELAPTDVAQPAIFLVSVALVRIATEMGLRPRLVAGHSLGEYTAAVAAGALSWKDALRVVCARGRLMAGAQAGRSGTMAAVSGLDADRVKELCVLAGTVGTVVAANLNGPGQTVVSGDVAAVDRVAHLALEAGADDVVRLRVGAAFHSPLMQPVQDELEAILDAVAISDPSPPLVANATGEVAAVAAEVRRALAGQVTLPVLWSACLATLRREGCDAFLELGPGRVVTGLARLNDPDADAYAADSVAKLEAYLGR